MYGDSIHPIISSIHHSEYCRQYGGPLRDLRSGLPVHALTLSTSHSQLQASAAHSPPTRLCAADVRAREVEVLELDGCTPCNTTCQRSSSAQRSVRMDALEATRNATEPVFAVTVYRPLVWCSGGVSRPTCQLLHHDLRQRYRRKVIRGWPGSSVRKGLNLYSR